MLLTTTPTPTSQGENKNKIDDNQRGYCSFWQKSFNKKPKWKEIVGENLVKINRQCERRRRHINFFYCCQLIFALAETITQFTQIPFWEIASEPCVCVCLSVCLGVWLFAFSMSLSFCQSVCLRVCKFVFLSVWKFVFLSVCLSESLSFCMP